MKLPVTSIKVSHDRMREDLGDIDALANSIKRFGQLQPVIIDEQNELIDGFRRFTAVQRAGLTEIETVQRAEVSVVMLRELELEANIQRKDMTWQERVKALAEIDALRKAADPTWNQAKTAALAETHQPHVSAAITMAKMMELFPEIAEAKSLHQAQSWAKHKAATVLRKQDVAANKDDFVDIESRLVLGDSVEIIRGIPDETFHAIITDPPFGIDYDSRKTNKAGVETAYEDGPEAYRRLLSMAPDLYRTLRPNGWLVWFFGISWYEECVTTFEAAGFKVDPLPIVWNRSGGKCHTNRPDKYFARGYDLALHCHKGDPEVVDRGKPNVITIDPVATHDRELMVERPVELYAELIRRLTIPGEVVADFFSGSGSCLAAAASTRRNYFGVELNPERRLVALQKIKAYTPDRG